MVPTIYNTFQIEEPKPPASCYGQRHNQLLLIFILHVLAYTMRVNLSVGIVAMTDIKKPHRNPDVPTYDWKDKSVILSSFFWGYIVLQIFAGYIMKKYGAKWFLAGSMTIGAIACAVTPIMAHTFGSKGVMACRVVQGLTQGFLLPSIHYMLGNWAPTPERSKLGTFAFGGAPCGTITGMVITGLLCDSWVGWPACFYLFAGLSLAWVVVWIFLGYNSPAEHPYITPEEKYYIQATLGQLKHEKVETPWLSIATSLPVWAILVAHCGQNWGYSTLITEIPTYMNKVMGYDMTSNSLLSSAPYLALWILSLMFGPISDALINRKTFSRGIVRKIFHTIGTWVPAAALVILGYMPDGHETISVILLIIAVGMNSAVFCGYQVNHIDLSPNHSGVLMGITNGLSNILSIIAPLAVQIVVTDETDKSLWAIIFLIAGVIYVGTTIFFNLFATGELQSWNFGPESSESPSDKKISATSDTFKSTDEHM